MAGYVKWSDVRKAAGYGPTGDEAEAVAQTADADEDDEDECDWACQDCHKCMCICGDEESES